MTPTAAPPGNDPRGPGPANPEIRRRLASAAVLAAIALIAVVLSPWTFLALVIVASALLAWEWGGLTRGHGLDWVTLLSALGIAGTALLVAIDHAAWVPVLLAAIAAAILAFERPLTRTAWALFGLLYLAFAAWALMTLRTDPHLGLAAILFLLTVAWTTDSASYFGGRAFGGPKLAPSISPKKTWSGFLIGTLSPALLGLLFAYWLGETTPIWLALIAVLLAFACQLGDLLESAIKRHFGAKDMSQLIPGHGGLFDRVDSFLLASIAAGLVSLRNPIAPGAGLLIW